MAERNPPSFLQEGSHPAEGDRLWLSTLLGLRSGIVSSTDLAVSQNGTPNMSVNVAAGRAVLLGTEATLQGAYHVVNDATKNLVIAAADASNPRRDLIVAKVIDPAYSGTPGTGAWSLAVVTGTPAASPADPTAPANSITLARVAVAALASSITNANITDLRRRASALGGVIVCTSSTRPSSPFEGMEIYETDTDKKWIYSGSAWVDSVSLGSWAAYTPTVGGGWSIGNGSASGRYMVLGKTLFLSGEVVAGSTTTFGANPTVSIPAGLTLANIRQTNGVGLVRDDSSGALVMCYWRAPTTSTLIPKHPDGSTNFSATSPITFANNDSVSWNITAELA